MEREIKILWPGKKDNVFNPVPDVVSAEVGPACYKSLGNKQITVHYNILLYREEEKRGRS